MRDTACDRGAKMRPRVRSDVRGRPRRASLPLQLSLRPRLCLCRRIEELMMMFCYTAVVVFCSLLSPRPVIRR